MEWAYGVTTVPERLRTLLPQTLCSLAAAGFGRPRLFVDGVADCVGGYSLGRLVGEYQAFLDEQFPGLDFTVRFPRVRTAGHWVLSLYELYLRQPNAERFAVFQDDLVTYRNLRPYLERIPYPDPPAEEIAKAGESATVMPAGGGYWNLFTSPANQDILEADGRPGAGHVGFYESNGFGRGAVALIFSRLAVTTLLTAKHLVVRPQDFARGHKAIDGGIVDSFRKAGWKELVHNPSLVQHTGEVSSMRNNPQKPALSFIGEEADALTFLERR